MPYSILFKHTAVKSIDSLPKKEREKVCRVVESLKTNPFSGKKLAGEFKDFYSVRAWPYRIIYTIIKMELIVLVVDVGHRQGVYKK